MNKTKLTISILVIALVLVSGLYIYDQYKEHQQERDIQVFQAGAEAQIIDIIKVVAQCKETYPITIQNQTITLVAYECLQEIKE